MINELGIYQTDIFIVNTLNYFYPFEFDAVGLKIPLTGNPSSLQITSALFSLSSVEL